MELSSESSRQPLYVPELVDMMEHYRYLIQDQPLDDGETREDVDVRAGRYYVASILGGGYTPQQIAVANNIVFCQNDEEFYGRPK